MTNLPIQSTETLVFYVLTDPVAGRVVDKLRAGLPPDDHRRALAFRRAEDGRDFVVAHALLGAVLRRSSLTHVPLARDAHGRPYLACASHVPSFNLTHTSGLVACALSWVREVGVDAERISRLVDVRTVARDCLTDGESRLLEASGTAARTFSALWTLKEAVAKAMGLGLLLPFQSLELDLTPLRLRIDGRHADEWELHSHNPSLDHTISVASRGPVRDAALVAWHEVRLTGGRFELNGYDIVRPNGVIWSDNARPASSMA